MRLALLISLFLIYLVGAQPQKAVNFLRCNANVTPNFATKSIQGQVAYLFEVTAITDSIFLDAQNMKIDSLYLNAQPISYTNTQAQIKFKAPKRLGRHSLSFNYRASPKKALYFVTLDSMATNYQMWTQGQGKNTSNWLPSLDDMNDKMVFNLTITTLKNYTVVANGQCKAIKLVGENRKWQFQMQHPISSYLVAFVIGNYHKIKSKSASGVPLEFFYTPKDSAKVEPTYRYSKKMFDYLEKEIGVAYPWQNYKQIPVHDFLYAGMENASCTLFSSAYMVDSTAFKDKNYVNVNAHELAHQWFGNLVTETSPKEHWLHEGFATYYAYLAEKEVFGEDYFYWRLYDTALLLQAQQNAGEGEALTNPKASSLTFYEKGAWALVMLRELVGSKVFKTATKAYIEKYAFGNVDITNFLNEIEKRTSVNINKFKAQWLENKSFNLEMVLAYLSTKSNSIKHFLTLKKQAYNPQTLAQFSQDSLLLQKLIAHFRNQISVDQFNRLLQHENIKVRQAALNYLPKIETILQASIENLLFENSYQTQEVALYKLWKAYPAKQEQYLEQTKSNEGFANKNLRLLWLTLALATPNYAPQKTTLYLNELQNFTHPWVHFEIRQQAFNYLLILNAITPVTLKNLLEASTHKVWQFKKSARHLLWQWYNSKNTLDDFSQFTSALTQKELKIFKTILSI